MSSGCGHDSGSLAKCYEVKDMNRMVHKNEPVNKDGSYKWSSVSA